MYYIVQYGKIYIVQYSEPNKVCNMFQLGVSV